MGRLSIFLLVAALVAGVVGCDRSTPPQGIWDWYDLDAITDNLGGNYMLMNDLDSTTGGYEELASPTANQGKGWQPIGTRDAPFTGVFDGQAHKTKDVFINRPAAEEEVGVFGCVGGGGVVKNLGLVAVAVTGEWCVGGLVGLNYHGNVSNCYATGNVTGDGDVGGLVGHNEGAVSNSHATGNVTGCWYVGGLVGYNEGTVSNSYATGNVTGDEDVGGLVGYNDGTVSNSYSTSTVTGSESVGSLVGAVNFGTVSNSYSTGNVTGAHYVGGLVGYDYCSTVSNSYYNYDEVLINGENIITIGALFTDDFEEWLANGKFLDVSERLSQENGYCVINNVSDFKELLAFGQNGSLRFRLKHDFDLASEPNFYIPYFAGELDGNGHRIANLSFNCGFVGQAGLFGHLAPSGKVSKVGVENASITAAWAVGGLLVGSNYYGTVSNSYVTGNVTGNWCVGSLVGFNYHGNVSNSYATANVTGEWYVGGLLGLNCGTVSNSYSTGNVTGEHSVGGLVGGNVYGTVSNSFWDIQTSGQATSAGGTGKTTAEMKSMATFSWVGWDIVAVANHATRNPAYIWNIVDGTTYPFLSWQPV